MPISEEAERALLAHIPSLKDSSWKPTSPPNPSYNCFAWAARESTLWIEPPGTASYRCWPKDLPDFLTVGNYVRAYERLGFEECDNREPEADVEKIAIFEDSDKLATHAARQLPCGRWTSKWGRSLDFEHELDELDGAPMVGSVAVIMKRQSPGPPPDPPPGLVVTDDVEGDGACIFD